MTPPKGVEAVGMAARTPARMPLSPISVESSARAAGGGVTNPVIRGRLESQDATIMALQAQVAVLVANAQAGMLLLLRSQRFRG